MHIHSKFVQHANASIHINKLRIIDCDVIAVKILVFLTVIDGITRVILACLLFRIVETRSQTKK
jgi:hypothetical protein